MFSRADIDFHVLILEACRNTFLARFAPLVEILIQTTLDLYSEGGWYPKHIQGASLPLHGALTETIANGDEKAADAVSRSIIETAQIDMWRALTRFAAASPGANQ